MVDISVENLCAETAACFAHNDSDMVQIMIIVVQILLV